MQLAVLSRHAKLRLEWSAMHELMQPFLTQAWASAWRSGQLLQPPDLASGHDLRLIRTARMTAGEVEQLLLYDQQAGPSGAPGLSSTVCSRALSQGFTLSLRELSHRWLPAALLAEALEAQFGLPAGGNLYCSPAGESSLLALDFCAL